MTENTYLPGKDAALEETITQAESRLETLGVEIECTSWLNPTPDCWSVHLQVKGFPWLYTNGKGCSKLASYASALGEFFERLSTNFLFSDFYLEHVIQSGVLHHRDEKWWKVPDNEYNTPFLPVGNTPFLCPELLQFYSDPEELLPKYFLDHNSEASHIDSLLGVCTLPFKRLQDGATIQFPAALLNNLYVSNGMAAGNSIAECRTQALCEIIERYVKNRIIAGGISLPDVPEENLQSPHIRNIIQTLQDNGFNVQVKDASLGGRYPVICVLLTDPSSAGAYAAFGASCRFNVAVERTLTELLQGRQLDSLHIFSTPVHDLEMVADPFNLESHFVDSDGLLGWRMFYAAPDFNYSAWDFSGTTEQEYTYLCSLLTRKGYDIFIADYTQYGMYCCRIVIPGMSEIYPVDDLVFHNRNRGAQLRDLLLNMPDMSADELLAIIDLLEEEGFHDQQKIGELTGILFDQGSGWRELSVGELKAMIYLAAGNPEEAQHWATWCIDHSHLSEKKKREYKIIHNILGFELLGVPQNKRMQALFKFFHAEEIIAAHEIVAGRIRFSGLTFGKRWRDISHSQSATIKLYEQLLQNSQDRK